MDFVPCSSARGSIIGHRTLWRVLFLFGMTVIIGIALADEQAQPDKSSIHDQSAKDAYHLVFFREHRPLVVRLQIEIDGKKPQAKWDEFIHSLFTYLDRDANGF